MKATETTLFRQNAAKIQEAMSDSARPPRAPTARMIATGPLAANRNATIAATAYGAPTAARMLRGPGGGETIGSSVPSALGLMSDTYAVAVPTITLARWPLNSVMRGAVRVVVWSLVRIAWKMAFLVSLVGVASHLVLDLTNVYGIRLLLPFSARWLRLDITSVVDPWIWAALLLSVIIVQ